jgi:hypothetical protein
MDAMRSLLVLNTITPLGLIMVVHHTGQSTYGRRSPAPRVAEDCRLRNDART